MSRFAKMDDRLKRPSAADCDPSKGTPPKSVPGDDEDTDDEETEAGNGRKDKEKDMTEAEIETMKAEARAEGVKAERARFDAVLASEHYTGREATAHKLLGKDMSADDIIDVLATAPVAAAAEAEAPDAEAVQRDEMKKALAETGNSKIDPNGGGKSNNEQTSAQIWDAAIAKINPNPAS
jgi:hypothetical protein